MFIILQIFFNRLMCLDQLHVSDNLMDYNDISDISDVL